MARDFLKCPACGHNVPRGVFTRGALGHALIALRQEFLGRGHGDNGGAVRWRRRAMTQGELEHVGRAVAVAGESIATRLGEHVDAPEPDEVLATLDDDEAEQLAQAWVEESMAEYVRRQEIVDEDRRRRRTA